MCIAQAVSLIGWTKKRGAGQYLQAALSVRNLADVKLKSCEQLI